ncbi:hypothetical protein ED733_005179 [Metarhizium rileyi]|uniref:Uncharacterized protein n=1 Tax=Metarhizium rileyi (strain RCEF 4871) TaxID=1649241 RepID=A0A5C6G9I6_METRR|nr:hypothetical protein ED733_005179 [Metarhizium rileyi]
MASRVETSASDGQSRNRKCSSSTQMSAASSQDDTNKPGPFHATSPTEITISGIHGILSQQSPISIFEEEQRYFPTGLSVLEPRPVGNADRIMLKQLYEVSYLLEMAEPVSVCGPKSPEIVQSFGGFCLV